MPSILTEPVRIEFSLSDAQLGLFTGVAYGLSLAVFVLPMGAISDRLHRRNFLSIIVLVWSVCTALGGLARTFFQLVFTRAGVGAAEAGAAPAALPMLLDMFPRHRQGLAIGMFYLSANLGAVVASGAGGWVAENHGWRTALFLAGAPGIVAALLLFFTVDEPLRGEMDGDIPDDERPEKASFIAVLVFLGRKPALIFLIGGCSMLGLISISLGAWAASFFVRVHELSLTEVGLLIGVFGGAGGVLAPLIYGKLSDTLSLRDPAWPLRLVAISAILGLGAGMTMLFSSSIVLAIIGYGCGEFLRSGYPPPAYSTLLSNTPANMRGTVTSILQFSSILIGFGLGPLLIGVLSDIYGGGTAIRYALATGLLVFVPVTIFFLVSSRMLFKRP